MAPFDSNMKMAELIHSNYLLLPILNRFDIQLGFGDRTINEICKEHGINTDFFLVILNSFHDHEYFPEEKLLSFPLQHILDYVKKSHKYYLEIKVPQIENLIRTLKDKSGKSEIKHIELIEHFFEEYKAELIEHIEDEENNVYPYVTSIDKAFNEGRIDKSHVSLIRKNSIRKYANAHTNVEDKLFDLKNILIKYLPPAKDYSVSNALLIELFRLERDLNDHARIEDKILFPKVGHIEKEILDTLT
jgi:regulator of cell morphogenesis and NO signaling